MLSIHKQWEVTCANCGMTTTTRSQRKAKQTAAEHRATCPDKRDNPDAPATPTVNPNRYPKVYTEYQEAQDEARLLRSQDYRNAQIIAHEPPCTGWDGTDRYSVHAGGPNWLLADSTVGRPDL